MGNGGSTAVSCSSLDLANHHNLNQQQQRHYRQLRQQSQQLHEQRMQKYRKQQLSGKNACNLKQSNSYFDISLASSSSNFHNADPHRKHPFNVSSAEFQRELASYKGAQCQSPVLVLPSQPPIGIPLSGAKKSNAGVASKILQQRQQQRHQQLKRFSDSMPSLNNLIISQPTTFGLHQQPLVAASGKMQLASPSNGRSYFHQNRNSCSSHTKHVADSSHTRQQHTSSCAKQVQGVICHPNSNINDTKLVSKFDENSHDHYQQQQQSLYEQNHDHSRYHHKHQQKQSMKRATSLSSLHNLHNQHLDYDNLCHARKPKSTKHDSHAHSHAVKNSIDIRPESMNAWTRFSGGESCNYGSRNSYDLYKSSHNGSGRQMSESLSQQQCKQHNQPPVPLGKKVHKFKQAAAVSGYSPSRYKSKQQVKSQQQQQQQQGCQVLPPLPRSQSLHELIQLRSTENGQRMRTTGTLRGQFSGTEASSKVNLVAELLETRRQQKLGSNDSNDDQDIVPMNGSGSIRNSTAILSQCSSSDDGIHDVSFGAVDQQATFESRKELHHDEAEYDRSRLANQPKKEKSRLVSGSAKQYNQHRRDLSCAQDAVVAVSGKFKSYDLSSPRPDSVSDEKTNHKSTLKRSLSHSSLHATNNNLDGINQSANECLDDGNESDDLNELARFIYQFKQRQEVKKASQNAKAAADKNHHLFSSKQQSPDSLNANEDDDIAQRTSCTATGANSSHQVGTIGSNSNNLQQSPNSTTSSSGFATCTSNSIASSISDEGNRDRRFLEQKPTTPGKHLPTPNLSSASSSSSSQSGAAQSSKNQSRKKYPAPPRPYEKKQIETRELSSSRDALQKLDAATSSQSSASKHLISGRLKLSSSLLSIVDEYNSTVQSTTSLNRMGDSAAKGVAAGSNLTAVLLRTDELNNEGDINSNSQGEGVGTHERHHPHDCDLGSSASPEEGNSSQLEHLKRYTQLRQMSQSELALNHLTSVPPGIIQQKRSSALGKLSNQGNNSNTKQPYRNKLINLIRRISDKSDSHLNSNDSRGKNKKSPEHQIYSYGDRTSSNGVSGTNSAGGHHRDVGRRISAGENKTNYLLQQQELSSSGGGKNQLGAINQNDQRPVTTTAGLASSGTPATSNGLTNGGHHLNGKYFNERGKILTNDGLGGDHPGQAMVRGHMSESLCDLNFDCDLELIKNCRSSTSVASTATMATDEHDRAYDNLEQQQMISSSLLLQTALSVADLSNSGSDCASGKQQQQKLSKQQINEQQRRGDSGKVYNNCKQQAKSATSSSKGENNNWRLVPTPLSLASQSAYASTTANIGDGVNLKDQKHHPSHQLRHEHSSIDTKVSGCPVAECPAHAAEARCSDSPANGKPVPSGNKLKWPATSWLMNGGAKNKLKQRQREQQKCCSQNRLVDPESISRNGARESKATGKNHASARQSSENDPPPHQIAVGAVAHVGKRRSESDNMLQQPDTSSEADQLLVELDQSLDRVRGVESGEKNGTRPPFSRKAALSWWKSTSSSNKNNDASNFNDHQGRHNSTNYEDDLLSRMRKHQQQQRQQQLASSGRSDYLKDVEDESDFSSEENSAVLMMMKSSGKYGSDDMSDDDDDDGDYASLNRAMINETFGVEPNQGPSDETDTRGKLSHRPGSPSDSFTFSIPESPVLQPITGEVVDGRVNKLLGSAQLPRQETGAEMPARMANELQQGDAGQLKKCTNFETTAPLQMKGLISNNMKGSNHTNAQNDVRVTCTNITNESENPLRPVLSLPRLVKGRQTSGHLNAILANASGCKGGSAAGFLDPVNLSGVGCEDDANGNKRQQAAGKGNAPSCISQKGDLYFQAEVNQQPGSNKFLLRHNELETSSRADPLRQSDGQIISTKVGGSNNCNSKPPVQIKKHERGARNGQQMCCDTTAPVGLSPKLDAGLHPNISAHNLNDHAGSGCCKMTVMDNPDIQLDTRVLGALDYCRARHSQGVNGDAKSKDCCRQVCAGDDSYNLKSHLINCKTDGKLQYSSNSCYEAERQQLAPSDSGPRLDSGNCRQTHCKASTTAEELLECGKTHFGPAMMAQRTVSSQGRGSGGPCAQSSCSSCNQNNGACCNPCDGITKDEVSRQNNDMNCCQKRSRLSPGDQCNGVAHGCYASMVTNNPPTSAGQAMVCGLDSGNNGCLSEDNSSERGVTSSGSASQAKVDAGKYCSKAHVNGDVKAVQRTKPKDSPVLIYSPADLHDNSVITATKCCMVKQMETTTATTQQSLASCNGACGLLGDKKDNKLIIHQTSCLCSSAANNQSTKEIVCEQVNSEEAVTAPLPEPVTCSQMRFRQQPVAIPQKNSNHHSSCKSLASSINSCGHHHEVGKSSQPKTSGSSYVKRRLEASAAARTSDGLRKQQHCQKAFEDSRNKINGNKSINGAGETYAERGACRLKKQAPLAPVKNIQGTAQLNNSQKPNSHPTNRCQSYLAPSDGGIRSCGRDKLSCLKGGHDNDSAVSACFTHSDTSTPTDNYHCHDICPSASFDCSGNELSEMSALQLNGGSRSNHSANSGRLLQGAARIIKSKLSIMNPICRSNSELGSLYDSGSNKSRIYGSKRSSNINDELVQLGKLRNSMQAHPSQEGLNATKHFARGKMSSNLAASQISLVNYYSSFHLNSSQLLGSSAGKKQFNGTTFKVESQPDGRSTESRDFDDNFILKRKTPNAGLKTQC